MPKFPNAWVPLVNESGNAFAILSRTDTALKKAGATKIERDEFRTEATAGDFDHLLRTVVQWVDTSDLDHF